MDGLVFEDAPCESPHAVPEILLVCGVQVHEVVKPLDGLGFQAGRKNTLDIEGCEGKGE